MYIITKMHIINYTFPTRISGALQRGTLSWRHVSRAPGPKNTNFCPELPFDLNNMNMKSIFSNGLPINK